MPYKKITPYSCELEIMSLHSQTTSEDTDFSADHRGTASAWKGRENSKQ